MNQDPNNTYSLQELAQENEFLFAQNRALDSRERTVWQPPVIPATLADSLKAYSTLFADFLHNHTDKPHPYPAKEMTRITIGIDQFFIPDCDQLTFRELLKAGIAIHTEIYRIVTGSLSDR